MLLLRITALTKMLMAVFALIPNCSQSLSNCAFCWLSIRTVIAVDMRKMKILQKILESGSILEHTAADGKTYKTQFYNLDAIISVGYRVNSINATAFRRWATRVLNNYLLKGYSVNQQLLAMQRQFDSRLEEHSLRMTRIEDKQAEQQEQLDFFIRTSTPPAEMVFFEGDFYTARVALENLVSSANHRVIVIDAYVSVLTLDFLNIRKSGVEAIIYTVGVGQGMQRLMEEHDRL